MESEDRVLKWAYGIAEAVTGGIGTYIEGYDLCREFSVRDEANSDIRMMTVGTLMGVLFSAVNHARGMDVCDRAGFLETAGQIWDSWQKAER